MVLLIKHAQAGEWPTEEGEQERGDDVGHRELSHTGSRRCLQIRDMVNCQLLCFPILNEERSRVPDIGCKELWRAVQIVQHCNNPSRTALAASHPTLSKTPKEASLWRKELAISLQQTT